MALANTAQGAGSWLAIGEETTEGTAVTPDAFAAYQSEGIKASFPRAPHEPLGQPGGAIATNRDMYITTETVGGPVTTGLRYDDMVSLILWKHLFGTVATAGSNPYTYTYTPTRAKPVKPSLTVEIVRGTGGSGTDRAETYSGCRVAEATLSATVGGIVTCAWSIMGIASEGLAAATSPTFESGRKIVLHNHVTNFTFNSNQFEAITGIDMVIRKALEGTPQLGQLTSGPMQMAGIFECLITVRHRYTENAQQLAYQAGTQGTGSLTITNGTESMVFSFAKLDVEDHTMNVGSTGLIEATTVLRVLSTPSDDGVELVITNTVSP